MKYNDIFISEGNTKIGKIPSVSLDVGVTCSHKWVCNKSCYAKHIAAFRPNVREQWLHNTRMLLKDPKAYERSIMAFLAAREPRYFRWHVGGEVINAKHASLIKRIALYNPDTRFLLYTRRDDLPWKRRAPNLKIFFSFWQLCGEREVPKKLKGEALAIIGDEPDKRAMQCPGGCEDCMFCFKSTSDKAVQFKVH